MARLDIPMKATRWMRKIEMHERKVDSAMILRLCKILHVPNVCYEIHLRSATKILSCKWQSSIKKILELTLGAYLLTREARLPAVMGPERLAGRKVVVTGKTGKPLRLLVIALKEKYKISTRSSAGEPCAKDIAEYS